MQSSDQLSALSTDTCPQCGWERAEEPSAALCPTCQMPLKLIAGKYRLTRLLSEGGIGRVFEAHHTQLSRDPKRAIKLIKPSIMKRAGMDERFRREVQVTGSLSQENQHIVRIYDDFGEEKGLGHYYVMEFLEGEAVDQMLVKYGRQFPLELAYRLFTQLCDAMQDAHAEKIIHRDLKPENLFVISKRREPHFLKVIDFGIAKPLGSNKEVTKVTGKSIGTPAYMSPEQCTNGNVDARSDVYAMGCILFELLSGYAPFSVHTMGGEREPSLMEIFTFHLVQSPPLLHDFLPSGKDVPLEMGELIRKAMSKHPEERFANVEEMERAFLKARNASTAIMPSPFIGMGEGALLLNATPPPPPPMPSTPVMEPLSSDLVDLLSGPAAPDSSDALVPEQAPSFLDVGADEQTLPGGAEEEEEPDDFPSFGPLEPLEASSSDPSLPMTPLSPPMPIVRSLDEFLVGQKDPSFVREQQPTLPEATPKRGRLWVWISAALVLVGAIGGGSWWWLVQSVSSAQPNTQHEILKSPVGQRRMSATLPQAKVAITNRRGSLAPKRPALPSRRPALPSRRPALPSRRPIIRPSLPRPALPRPRRHKSRRRRVRPKQRRRVSPKHRRRGRLVALCPMRRGVYWMRLMVKPTTRRVLKFRWRGRTGLVRKKTWGFCVGARHKRARLAVRARGHYHACQFSVWGRRKKSYHLQMISEDEPAPHPTNITDYCLK